MRTSSSSTGRLLCYTESAMADAKSTRLSLRHRIGRWLQAHVTLNRTMAARAAEDADLIRSLRSELDVIRAAGVRSLIDDNAALRRRVGELEAIVASLRA